MKKRFVTFIRIIKTGVVNFFRNAWLAMAAIAIMVVTLTVVLFSVIANATFNHTIDQFTAKIDFSVYLKDSTTVPQKDQLLNDLRKLPNVKSLKYQTKDEVLEQYKKQNASKPELISALSQTDNPLPATIQIKPRDLNKVQDIKDFLNRPTELALIEDVSYKNDRKQAIDKIAHATNILQRAGLVVVAVFAVISVLIIFNTIQMAIFNRRDELTIMRLLGASTTFIRGPFVVESALYGIVSALLSVGLIHSLFVASKTALEATSLGLLDIGYSSQYFADNFLKLLGMQVGVGVAIGILSSIIATRRYLKFKSK
jgi:cell division transport system permease protein